MTDLLTRPTSRPPGSAPGAVQRPLWLRAAAAGLLSSGTVLAVCMALGLVAWFASDAGSHGDTRDAIRVGADAWLLAHGAGLALPGAAVTAVPLGLTVLCLWSAARAGRWAVRGSTPEDLAGAALAVVVLGGLYGLVALGTAVLAGTPAAEPGLGRSVVGGLLVGTLGGGGGLASTSPPVAALRRRLPVPVRVALRGALATSLLLMAAGSVLAVTSLLLDLDEAANVLSRLHPDAAGAGLYTLVVAAAAPNAALLGASYLLGPGFAVGAGTVVSPATVVLGPLPAFPLLAALPDPGPGPRWAMALLAAPVLLAAVAAGLVVRRHRLGRYDTGPVSGLASGVLGAGFVTVLVGVAGGSVGPGRMAHVGAPLTDVLAAAVVGLGAGGLVGGLLATWWVRRTATADTRDATVTGGPRRTAGPDPSIEDTVRL